MGRNLSLTEDDVKRIALRLFEVLHEELNDCASMQELIEDVDIVEVNRMDFDEYAQLMLAVVQHMQYTLMFRTREKS